MREISINNPHQRGEVAEWVCAIISNSNIRPLTFHSYGARQVNTIMVIPTTILTVATVSGTSGAIRVGSSPTLINIFFCTVFCSLVVLRGRQSPVVSTTSRKSFAWPKRGAITGNSSLEIGTW